MKLSKSLRINGVVLAKGMDLQFGTEGYMTFKGQRIHKSQIPAAAVESVSQKRANKGSVLAKSIRLGDTVIPAGESLVFDNDGFASYNGKSISIYQIPSRAFKGTESYEVPDANNKVDIEKQFKAFDAVEPGDLGIGQDGEAVRFLGKATGKGGFDALVGQFGNASGKTFEDITAGMSDEDIDAAEFVSYTIPDGTVCIGIYGANNVVATESDDADFMPFSEINSGDGAVDANGKACVIVAKGEGSVWYDKMCKALKLDCVMGDIKKRLAIEDEDEFKQQMQNAEFAVVIYDNNDKSIDIYGANGIKVFEAKED